MDKRQNILMQWISKLHPQRSFTVINLAGDASFRRYFRIQFTDGQSMVAMDAPPDKEALLPFIHIAQAMLKQNLPCPQILAQNIKQGFLLLSDLGDKLLAHSVNQSNADSLYHTAIDNLLQFQTISEIESYSIPLFNAAYLRAELNLFEQWFLGEYLGISLNHHQQSQLEQIYSHLIQDIDRQTKVLIHRDYHSRNLMLTSISHPHEAKADCRQKARTELSIIDFQDAMIGPYGYDIVSLLKDCYIEWPEPKRMEYLNYYHRHASFDVSFEQLIKDMDYCGVQRHLKVLGIFSRLFLRDEKAAYLNNLPLTLKYLRQTAEKYHELGPLSQLINQISLP